MKRYFFRDGFWITSDATVVYNKTTIGSLTAHRVRCLKRAIGKCFNKAAMRTSNNRVNLIKRGISVVASQSD